MANKQKKKMKQGDVWVRGYVRRKTLFGERKSDYKTSLKPSWYERFISWIVDGIFGFFERIIKSISNLFSWIWGIVKSILIFTAKVAFLGLIVFIGWKLWVIQHPTPKAEAKDVLSGYPLLQRICDAESKKIQYRKDGRVLRGSVTPSDIGYCQINEPTWNDTARKLGYDIYTEDGNKQMAVYIFVHQGSDPWNSSKCSPIRKTNCWTK